MLSEGYDKNVGKLGLSKATRKMLGTFGEKVSADFEEGAERCLKEDPVLVVGTHPGRLHASATLAAMPDRDDSFIVGHAGLENVGQNFKEHLIPMALSKKKPTNPVEGFIGGVKNRIKQAIGFKQNNMEPAEAKAKNQENLGTAARIVNEGGRVLIFPDNVHKRGTGSKWLGGIGRLLSQMDPNAKIVFASANPSFTPGAALRAEHAVSTKVVFSEPMTVGEFLASSHDGEEADVDSVVGTIERKYETWRKGLK